MSLTSPPSHEMNPGDLFYDRYRIRNRIADGGMASIYLAVDESSGLNVAIKVLFSYYSENPVIRTRFMDEGRIQAVLRHPNIVHVYRVVPRPILSFVMEYVDGSTLEEYLKEQGPLNEREILAIILPVMSAVGFAHSKGIIHRDLKPSNILVSENDEGVLEPKVMDFGVAKVTSGRDLTATGTTVGTLHYMSPEQIIGSRSIDGRADIYSLGVTLYKLATGEVPFNASTEFALMMAQVEAPPLPPRSLRKDLSRRMEAIILKALEKEPGKRFQSIKDFTEALMAVTEGGGETETAPIPAGLLKFAMMADEVAKDRTDEFTLAHLKEGGADVWDTTEMEGATTEMSGLAFEELKRDAERVLRRKPIPRSDAADVTIRATLDQLSTAPRTLPVTSESDTREQDRPDPITVPSGPHLPLKPNPETGEQTRSWEMPKKPGVVALDLGADSKEVTSLKKITAGEYKRAMEKARNHVAEAAKATASSPQAPMLEQSTKPERPSAQLDPIKREPNKREPNKREPAPLPPRVARVPVVQEAVTSAPVERALDHSKRLDSGPQRLLKPDPIATRHNPAPEESSPALSIILGILVFVIAVGIIWFVFFKA